MVKPGGILPRSPPPRQVGALNAKPGRALDQNAGLSGFNRFGFPTSFRPLSPLSRKPDSPGGLSMKYSFVHLVFVSLLLLLMLPAANSQTITGHIAGSLVDPAGTVITVVTV